MKRSRLFLLVVAERWANIIQLHNIGLRCGTANADGVMNVGTETKEVHPQQRNPVCKRPIILHTYIMGVPSACVRMGNYRGRGTILKV